MTHVSTPIFQGLFKIIVFRSAALVIKKLRAILDFFYTHSRLFTALYPTLCVKKKFTKESFKLLVMKSQKFHGDSVKNESARAKKLEGGRQSPPSPSFYRVEMLTMVLCHLSTMLDEGL